MLKELLKIVLFFYALNSFALQSSESTNQYNLKTSDIVVRDPFVFVDSQSGNYYIQGSKRIETPDQKLNTSFDNNKAEYLAFYCYESKDLKNWRYVGRSYKAPKNFWGQGAFWAPDMFYRNGKYYIIATFTSERNIGKTLISQEHNINDGIKHSLDIPFRGCAALVSDKPEGPYVPVSDKPLTPENWSSLDGTIYEEDGQLWLIYCHEWVQIGDGEVVAQKISDDLSRCEGKPIVLFRASEAPWVIPYRKGFFVTDAPVINKTPNGGLFMTWSSFTKDKNGKRIYGIGLAKSDNGKVLGKWNHSTKPLNYDDGGHCMLFKTFGGKNKISYHSPNIYPEHTVIYDIEIGDDNIHIKNKK